MDGLPLPPPCPSGRVPVSRIPDRGLVVVILWTAYSVNELQKGFPTPLHVSSRKNRDGAFFFLFFHGGGAKGVGGWGVVP